MSPDGVAPPGEPEHDPWLDARVRRLEEDVGEIKAILRRLEPMIVRTDARLLEMVTKADLMAVRSELKGDIAELRVELKGDIAELRTELKSEIAVVRIEAKDQISDVKIALADKPTRTYMWGIMTAMVAAFACGLASLAILK